MSRAETQAAGAIRGVGVVEPVPTGPAEGKCGIVLRAPGVHSGLPTVDSELLSGG